MKKYSRVLLPLLLLSLFSCKKEEISPIAQRINVEESQISSFEVSKLVNNKIEKTVITSNNWMSTISGTKKLTELTIPGTHESGARFEPASGTAKCQKMTITQQLNAGIRLLDIRCRHINNSFNIHHGFVYQKATFDNVFTECINFLNANNQEVIIMSVKEEYTSQNVTRSFEQTFDWYLSNYPNLFYISDVIPTLGDVRGKIVLLRRFGANNLPKGIVATNWADNAVFSISGNTNLRVQDEYQVTSKPNKWTDISAMLNEAKNGASTTLFLNYSSGYTANGLGIPNIPSVSNYMNPKLKSFFTSNTQGRFGAVLMDFAAADKIKPMMQTNF